MLTAVVCAALLGTIAYFVFACLVEGVLWLRERADQPELVYLPELVIRRSEREFPAH